MRGQTLTNGIGPMLREWRNRRNLSQLALALIADTSSRHLSFIETGRAVPSRALLLRLAEHLDIPAHERNSLLMLAGYAPAYEGPPVSDSQLSAVNEAIDRLMFGHEPYPALLFDSVSDLRRTNQSAMALMEGVADHLLEPPANLLRLALHPDGMAPRIVNFPEWRAHLLGKLHRDAAITNNERLAKLYEEVSDYPLPVGHKGAETEEEASAEDVRLMAVPLRVRALGTELNFISTFTMFAAPVDLALAELTIEAFYPADACTAKTLHDRYWTEHSGEPVVADAFRPQAVDDSGRLPGSSWMKSARAAARTVR